MAYLHKNNAAVLAHTILTTQFRHPEAASPSRPEIHGTLIKRGEKYYHMPLRACLRLQCFPETFKPFPFCLYTAGKQVGNAFPPILTIPDLIQTLHALDRITNPEDLVRQLTLDLILQARPITFMWSKILSNRTYPWSKGPDGCREPSIWHPVLV